jgi:hypothetical protein
MWWRIKLIKCILILFLLSSCGPVIFTAGIIEVTSGDIVSSAIKKKIYDKKKKSTTDSKSESSD